MLRVTVSGDAEYRADLLAAEEPLEIRVDGTPLTVTMRTPGDDIDLAAGFLFTEGLLPRLDDVYEIRMCDENVAAVTLKPGVHAGLLPLAGHVLLVSGRASFELAQKAIMIGLPVLAAVSAPSSLAASLAEETGLTLVGFLRGATMNVYVGAQRVTADAFAALAAPADSGA